MDLREIGWEGVDWMHWAQDRNQWWPLVNTVMNLRVPEKAGNFLTCRMTISFLKRNLLDGVRNVSYDSVPAVVLTVLRLM
jgi:hypothetical protein